MTIVYQGSMPSPCVESVTVIDTVLGRKYVIYRLAIVFVRYVYSGGYYQGSTPSPYVGSVTDRYGTCEERCDLQTDCNQITKANISWASAICFLLPIWFLHGKFQGSSFFLFY